MIFDPAKRSKTLAERGLDFAEAVRVFEGVTVEIEDTRKDYGEKANHLLWPSRRQDRCDWVYIAGRIGSPRFQHEES